MTAVLDHGEVILVDSMAADGKVVAAARVSTGKGYTPGLTTGPNYLQDEKDRKLINYLMSNGHGTPFEHSVFQFFVKAPIFVVREWQRHRMASYNEQSGRYSEFKPEFYIPTLARVPDPNNKQSSVVAAKTFLHGDTPHETLRSVFDAVLNGRDEWDGVYEAYKLLLELGVAREMARMILPLNLYTSFWFTVNARSLMNFLMLRNHPNAQWEMQEYARALEGDFEEKMPMTHQAFVDAGRRAP